MKRKIISLLIVFMLFVTCFSINVCAYNANDMVEYLKGIEGKPYASGYCLRFVDESFENVYGYREYVCCAYKSGSAYVDSTSRDIPIGACVYFTGSATTCDICFNKAGHVGIYIGDGNIIHAWDGRVIKSSIDYIVSRGYPYRGWGWLCDKALDQDVDAPSTATLSVNKSLFSAGETVCFLASSQGATGYTIGIDKDGTRIYTADIGASFEKSFNEPGIYTAYVTAWNPIGLVDSNRVTFTVYNSSPGDSKLSVNKSVVVVGEEITFNCEAENATGYTIGIDKGNERIITQDMGRTFTKSFAEPGKYSAYVSAWNANGLLDSNRVHFVVYDTAPTSSELKIDKDAICVGDSIQFTCVSEEATGYTIGINKDGTRIFTQDISKIFTKSFDEVGVYTAYVTSWNTRGICDSAKVTFEVYDTVPNNCSIKADKQLVPVGDVVNLNFDAHNAKLFEIGLYINGERVWITPARGDYNELELEIDTTGVYEVWASAYNEYGYCDSSHITFIAFGKDNAAVLKNGDSVRIIKELNVTTNNYSCIIALYENQKLVKIVSKTDLNSTTILDETILCTEKYDKIKVMVWNCLSGMMPLCEAEEIPSSKWITE